MPHHIVIVTLNEIHAIFFLMFPVLNQIKTNGLINQITQYLIFNIFLPSYVVSLCAICVLSTEFGGDLSGMAGTIESPLYPSVYPHYASVMWTVTVPAGELILFSFTVMDIENDAACSFDYVKVSFIPRK